MECALLAHDGIGPPSGFGDTLMARCGGDPRDVVAFARDADAAAFAALAPQIVAAAEAGDHMALAAMDEGAAYLAGALRALGWRSGMRLSLCGGLGLAYAGLLPAPMRADLVAPEGTALDGALHLAAAPMAPLQAQAPPTEIG